MAVPKEIRELRPKEFGATEIRDFNGRYHVYLISSKWDPERKKARKVTGKSIGKITLEDGFIPNANGLRLMKSKQMDIAESPAVKNYGAYEMLRRLSPSINERLRKYFPSIFREIRTLALLRLVDSATSAKMMRPMFLASYMSDICPDLAISEASVRKFISRLGMMRDETESYMKNDIPPSSALMFDGTAIFARFSDSLSERGYNPDRSLNPQAKLLYVFEADTLRPVFYRALQGSDADESAFIDIAHSFDLKDCTIIADKGFYSKKNLSALMNAGMRFILPPQSNAANAKPEFNEDPNDRKWDNVFSCDGRAVWGKKYSVGNDGNYIFVYREDDRKAEMAGNYGEGAEADCVEKECEPMDAIDKKKLGYFALCGNMDTDLQEVYLKYKQRQDIEKCFDYLKSGVSPTASFAHCDEYFKGWAFLNHISLMYYYGLINALRKAKLDKKYSPAEVIKLTKNIYRVNTADGKYRVSNIQKKTAEILERLNVCLLS